MIGREVSGGRWRARPFTRRAKSSAGAPAARSLAHNRYSTSYHVGTAWWRLGLGIVVALAGAWGLGWLVLRYQLLPPLGLFSWLLVALVAWKPRVGLFVALTMVVLFEAGGTDQLMLPGGIFMGSLQSIGFTGGVASPLELLLLLMLFSWFATGVAGRRLDYRGGALGWPMLVFFLFLLVGWFWGVGTGGNPNIALWESRYLFYLVICYVVATNTIRTRRHVQNIISLFSLASGLFAVEGAFRKLVLVPAGAVTRIPEFQFAHESATFLATLILLVAAQHLFGAPRWQRLFGLFVCLPVGGFTLMATERRAGQMSLLVAFLAVALVLFWTRRRAFYIFVVPLILLGMVYFAAFWNNTGTLGQPVRAVRSSVLGQADARDAASNAYRDTELINVRATIDANPILGVGFGQEFYFVVPMPDLSWWPFWHYEPHHNILWVWLKLGAPGFIAFWVLMGSALLLAAHYIRTLHFAENRILSMLTLVALVGLLVYAYVDLALVAPRVTVLLGTLMGALAVVKQVEDNERAIAAASTSRPVRAASARAVRPIAPTPLANARPDRVVPALYGTRPAGIPRGTPGPTMKEAAASFQERSPFQSDSKTPVFTT